MYTLQKNELLSMAMIEEHIVMLLKPFCFVGAYICQIKLYMKCILKLNTLGHWVVFPMSFQEENKTKKRENNTYTTHIYKVLHKT
jgi:hypothetical protein